MLGEKVASASVFPHLYVYCHTYKYSATRHSGSCTPNFGNFINEVCHVVKITIAQRNPDGVLLTKHFALASTS